MTRRKVCDTCGLPDALCVCGEMAVENASSRREKKETAYDAPKIRPKKFAKMDNLITDLKELKFRCDELDAVVKTDEDVGDVLHNGEKMVAAIGAIKLMLILGKYFEVPDDIIKDVTKGLLLDK